MKKNQAYQRLPGRRRTFGSWYTLWLGQDHLLSVQSTSYSEEYTRFYLADIRGVVTRRTRSGYLWSAVLALVTAAFALAALFGGSRVFANFYGFLAAGFLVATLVNIFRGATCVCHALMPLGSQRLPALAREKQVAKVVHRLAPLVTAIQGTVSAEELAAAASAEPVAASPRRAPAGAAPGRGGAPRHPERAGAYRGGAHWALFSLLLVEAGFSLFQLTMANRLVSAVASLLQLLLFAATIIALVQQRESSLPKTVKGIAWGALGTLSASLITVQSYGVISAFPKMAAKGKGHDLQQLMLEITPLNDPFMAGQCTVYLITVACLGLFGLFAMYRWQGKGTGGSPSA